MTSEHVASEGDEESRLLPERRGHDETAILGYEKHLKEMDDADPGMEIGAESIYDLIRR
jgi:hypothetical protein